MRGGCLRGGLSPVAKMAASLNSQGITQWPETWARVVHAGDINSGAVAEAGGGGGGAAPRVEPPTRLSAQFETLLDDLEWLSASSAGAGRPGVRPALWRESIGGDAPDGGADAAGWEELWDEGRQRAYYHHTASGAVQWRAPAGFEGAAGDATAAAPAGEEPAPAP